MDDRDESGKVVGMTKIVWHLWYAKCLHLHTILSSC